MSLTDTQIKGFKAKDKAYKVADTNGLSLRIFPSGKKTWQFRYFLDKKEYTMSLGEYPIISLKDARDKAFALKNEVFQGKNPKLDRDNRQFTNFKEIALDFLNKQANIWSPRYYKKVVALFHTHIFPYLEAREITSIQPADVLAIVRKIEERKQFELASKTLEFCSRIFRFAVASSLCPSDPCRDLSGALTPYRNTPLPAIVDPKEVGELMRTIRAHKIPTVRNMLLFSAYTFCRPGEIHKASWEEIDFAAKEWRIPAERMKMRVEHRVPLSKQCIKILQEQKKLCGKDELRVFPSKMSGKQICKNTAGNALKYLGYDSKKMCPHGFRSMASTLLNEKGYNPDVIEKCLAHSCSNQVRAVYNRAQYMEERKKLMQEYADYLDELANKS